MSFSGLRDYRKDTVLNYIRGLDVRNIDALEDDPKFMAAVISSPESNSSMYRFCSDKVKGNYDFVDTFITLFYDAPEMIIEASYVFIKLNENDNIYDEKNMEILVRTYDILSRNSEYKRNNPTVIENYSAKVKEKYLAAKEDFENDNKNSNTLGFEYICNKFNCNTYISSYIANNMINDLLNNNEVQRKFNSIFKSESYISNGKTINISRQLSETEMIALCAKVISSYDKELMSYVYNNYVIYSDMVTKIKTEIKKFNPEGYNVNKKLTLDSKKVVE